MDNSNSFPTYFLTHEPDGRGYSEFLRNKIQMDKYPSIFLVIDGKRNEYFFHDASNDEEHIDLMFYNKEKYSKLPIEDMFKHVNDAMYFYETVNEIADFTQIQNYAPYDYKVAKESIEELKCILVNFYPENQLYKNFDYSLISA